MSEPTIQAVNRPRTPQFTDVPEGIREWAAANGKRLSWQSNDPNLLSLKFGQNMVPLRQSDLEEGAPEAWKKISERHSIMVNDDGHFQRIDAVLCIQPIEDWEYWEEVERAPGRVREMGAKDMDLLEQEIQETLQSTGHASGQPVLTGRIPTAREAVYVSDKPQVATGVKVGSE